MYSLPPNVHRQCVKGSPRNFSPPLQKCKTNHPRTHLCHNSCRKSTISSSTTIPSAASCSEHHSLRSAQTTGKRASYSEVNVPNNLWLLMERKQKVLRCYLCHYALNTNQLYLISASSYYHACHVIFRSYNNEPEPSTDPADENHQLSKCLYNEPGLRNTDTPSSTSGNVSVL